MRPVHSHYVDPVDQIWTTCARRIGLRLSRTGAAYAATDGAKGLAIGTPDVLDADDCLAQMVFHELCHSLVEGEDSFEVPDWGLDNTSSRDEVREHACLRAQAFLATGYGLREVLAPTTDFRSYYDALDSDPLAQKHLPATQLAILALRRARTPPWFPHLRQALEATATIATATRDFGSKGSLWDLGSAAPPEHPTGLPGSAASAERRCGECAWQFVGGRGKQVTRCRQADGARVEPSWSGCAHWEPHLDCQECGACCRAAYHSVTVSRRDPAVELHPDLIEDRGQYVELRRDGDRCAALDGGKFESGGAFVPYQCLIYRDRPKPCREFENAGEHCLTARRRVGLSL